MVTIAERIHLYPYRTQKLSSLASKILGWRRPGKIESCHLNIKEGRKIFPLYVYSPLAQSVEHAAVNRGVVGSSPTRGAIQRSHTIRYGIFVFFLLPDLNCGTVFPAVARLLTGEDTAAAGGR